jgi:hypothetical protein
MEERSKGGGQVVSFQQPHKSIMPERGIGGVMKGTWVNFNV